METGSLSPEAICHSYNYTTLLFQRNGQKNISTSDHSTLHKAFCLICFNPQDSKLRSDIQTGMAECCLEKGSVHSQLQ